MLPLSRLDSRDSGPILAASTRTRTLHDAVVERCGHTDGGPLLIED